MNDSEVRKKAKIIYAQAERSFDTNVTKNQLMCEPVVVASWGANNWKAIVNKALMFEVKGAIHKGVVLITLGWSDLYTVRLLDYELNILPLVKEGIYAEDLVWVIDKLVETPKK